MPQVIAALVAIFTGGSLVGISAGAVFAATSIIGVGISLVFTGISALFRKTPSIGASVTQDANRNVTVRQPAAARIVVLGETARGGVLTFMEVSGANNEFLHMVITFTTHQIDSFLKIFFDGVEVTLDGSGDATGTYAGFVHIEKNLGSDNQSAFAGLVAALPSLWTANHRQRGCAGIYVRLKFDEKLFANGVPRITALIKGYNEVLDTRTATTGWSDNPALLTRAYLVNKRWGFKVNPARIPDAFTNAAANACDEVLTLKDGVTTTKRYTCNGTTTTDVTPEQAIPDLLSSMGGTMPFINGKWMMYAAVWRASTVTLQDGDFRSGLVYTSKVSRRDLANVVKGLYVSPVNHYEPADFPVYRGVTYVAEDSGYPGCTNKGKWVTATAYVANDAVVSKGGVYVCTVGHNSAASTEPGVGADWATKWAYANKVYVKDIELPFTDKPEMATRLAKVELEKIRRQGSLFMPCNLSGFRVQAADTMAVTHPSMGFTSKTFEITNMKFVQEGEREAPKLGVDLYGRETDSGVFGWNKNLDEPDLTEPDELSLPNNLEVAAPTVLSVTTGSSVATAKADGTKIPRVKLTWTAPADQMVLSGGSIEVQYKKNSSGVWLSAPDVAGNETEAYVDQVDEGVAYDFRIRSVNVSLVPSAWVQQLNTTVTAANSAINSGGIVANAPVNGTNDATVDSIDAGGGSITIRVYGPGGVGTAYTRYKGNGSVSEGPYSITSKLPSHYYFVFLDQNGNPTTADFFKDTVDDRYRFIGDVTTVAVGGGGGTSGGGGDDGELGGRLPGF